MRYLIILACVFASCVNTSPKTDVEQYSYKENVGKDLLPVTDVLGKWIVGKGPVVPAVLPQICFKENGVVELTSVRGEPEIFKWEIESDSLLYLSYIDSIQSQHFFVGEGKYTLNMNFDKTRNYKELALEPEFKNGFKYLLFRSSQTNIICE